MAPKRRRARAVVDEPLIESPEETPGSGQRFESHLADLAAQPELLAAAAQLLEQRRRATEASPSTSAAATPEGPARKKAKKTRLDVLDSLLGGMKDADGTRDADGGKERHGNSRTQAALRLTRMGCFYTLTITCNPGSGG